MDIEKIKQIIDLVTENNIAELELSEDKESIRICLNKNTSVVSMMAPAQTVLTQTPAASTEPNNANNSMPKHTINSPMVGSVYLSATPGSGHFVEVGQHVKSGDTLCLIEAMKMFNRIETDKAGVITAILIENAQAVEYNQPLFVIE
jgi:acetyl-CoA carboxylase biotin carboxyl carrier protein